MIAFNTAEGWAPDVTLDTAREIVDTSEPLSTSARDFVRFRAGLTSDCASIHRALERRHRAFASLAVDHSAE